MSETGEAAYGREAIEHVLGLWREGWRQARSRALPMAARGEYLGALAAVEAVLEARSTMQELCAWYFHPPAAVGRILDAVIHRASGRVLNRAVVEDAAYWRRAQVLIQGMSGGTDGEGDGSDERR